jgi:hypothetical protein
MAESSNKPYSIRTQLLNQQEKTNNVSLKIDVCALSKET